MSQELNPKVHMNKKGNIDLKHIEKRYDTQSIKSGDTYVWPLIRLKINEEMRNRQNLPSRTFKLDWRVLSNLLGTLFYGIENLVRIKRYPFWIFSSSDRRKRLNDKYVDRVTEGLISLYPESLVIENPHPRGAHFRKSQLYPQNIVSQTIFFALSELVKILSRKRLKIVNEELITKILEYLDVEVDYTGIVETHWARYRFMDFLLRYARPKMVFMVYTASSMGFIKAFKKRGIPVVELQHGIINEAHNAYNVPKNYGDKLFPDYLLTYGEKELDVFSKENYFIKPENVFPTGYYFLDVFVHSSLKSGQIKNLRNTFRKIVVLSLQDPFEKMFFDFLSEVVNFDDTIFFLAVPRDPSKPYSKLKDCKNFAIARELNIYESLKIADFHATINSTCAIEALYFGVPNILYDYNGWASDYYNKILSDSGHTVYVGSPEEFIDCIKGHTFYTKETIKEKSNFFIKKGFMKNVERVIKEEILG